MNLTAVRLLAPHLTPENHIAILAEATGMTRRRVDKLVARLAPQPDVPPSIRKLPAPNVAAAASAIVTHELEQTAAAPSGSGQSPVSPTTETAATERPTMAAAVRPAAQRPVVTALSPERYRVQFTVGPETEGQLRRLQDLLRGEIPDGDPGEIFARGLSLLLREVEKRKFAATTKPRPGRGTKAGSRHVPADIQRRAWQRRRCTERSYLEFHHAEPYSFGGETTVENISLRCRAHNVYEAELIFGPYDPSRVRETPAAYAASGGDWSRDR